MIYRMVESRMAFAITACAFALALMWNTGRTSAPSLAGHGIFRPVEIAHGPTLPPDPWAGTENLTAHGPTLPPDPWAGTENLTAHGPTLPPDPWAGTENLTAPQLTLV